MEVASSMSPRSLRSPPGRFLYVSAGNSDTTSTSIAPGPSRNTARRPDACVSRRDERHRVAFPRRPDPVTRAVP